jgi:TonB-dependent SusC/RagA subfamily outer membrane receptor
MKLLEWMLQATVLGVLFSAAAVLVEPLLVRRRRWAWLAAMVLSATLPLVALLAPSLWPGWLSWRVAPALPLSAVASDAGETMGVVSGRGGVVDRVTIAWAVLSLLCLARYVAGWLRLRSLMHGSVKVRLAGRELLLSERLGPAVVGWWRPRVVAPRWIMTVPPARQRMVIMHEAEHARAGDHRILAAAPLLAVLLPWNASLWWQLRRLRLAVELDCDARVLSRGVRPLEYGGLLLDVAGSTAAPVAPALAEPRSLLARRLEAVVRPQQRPGPSRCAALALASLGAAVSGCLAAAPVRVVVSSPVATLAVLEPTAVATPAVPEPAATVAQQGAAAVRTPARGSLHRGGAMAPHHTAGTASKDSEATIARVPRGASASDVVPISGSARVRHPVPAGIPVPTADGIEAHKLTDDTLSPVTADSAVNATPRTNGESALTAPLIIVDGVIISGRSIWELGLGPDDIERIEVLKGPAAAALYGARGADGVVWITTRRGEAGR